MIGEIVLGIAWEALGDIQDMKELTSDRMQ